LADVTALRTLAERALRSNWREGVRPDGIPYRFTCPAPPRYRHMWHWDSCFHAVAWRLFDPVRAREELRTVLRSGRGDGFLPHTVFWDRPAGWRRAPLYATQRWRGDRHTHSIGPPLLPWAWEIVAGDDAAFARCELPALATHLDWLAHERDPDGDGLLTILLPDESGLDDSPKYDSVYGHMAHYRPGYAHLLWRCRRLGWRSREIIAASEHHVEDVLVNVAYALSLRAMARMSGDARWDERADRTVAALVARCWDEERGLFWDLAGHAETPVRVSTWSSLAPLALPELPSAIAARLIAEHLLDERRYRAPYGIPSVSMDEPSFHPRFHLWRCWRGPSWMNTAYLLLPGLRRHGGSHHRGPGRGGAAQRPARVLRPAHRRRARRPGLRLVSPDRRPRRAGGGKEGSRAGVLGGTTPGGTRDAHETAVDRRRVRRARAGRWVWERRWRWRQWRWRECQRQRWGWRRRWCLRAARRHRDEHGVRARRRRRVDHRQDAEHPVRAEDGGGPGRADGEMGQRGHGSAQRHRHERRDIQVGHLPAGRVLYTEARRGGHDQVRVHDPSGDDRDDRGEEVGGWRHG
jgi:hypothetical protein